MRGANQRDDAGFMRRELEQADRHIGRRKGHRIVFGEFGFARPSEFRTGLLNLLA
jgi:hypothetical protein